MIKEHEIDKVVHEYSQEDDRWIYKEYDSTRKIIGLNFMQGWEYSEFVKGWCYKDPVLTEFYKQMSRTFTIEKASVNTNEFINKVMWAYHFADAATHPSNRTDYTDIIGVYNDNINVTNK
jgi:hypothetical protein|tara:strand:- start:294 stop:653 length:360 start_codon:yes stop_codon:yes gene_type:complete